MTSTADLVTESLDPLTLEETKPKSFRFMTNTERWNHTKELISIEPLIMFYVITAMICAPAMHQLEYEKACRVDAGYNDTVCAQILISDHSTFKEQNDNVQILITNVHAWQHPVQKIVPMILILFLGSYSDRHKLRKPFLLLPILGSLVSVIGCIMCVIFMRSWPLGVLGFFESILPSLFGGPTLFIMAAYSYIADVSTVEKRTIRIAIVSVALQICVTAVLYVSGPLFKAIGYIPLFLMAGVLFILIFLYGAFYLKEARKPIISEDKKRYMVMDIFNPKHVVDTFSVLFKNNPGNKRLHLFVVMAVLVITSFVGGGEMDIFYNFTNKVYDWTVVDFAFLMGNSAVIHLIGTAVSMALFTKVLHFSDYIIIIISLFDKVLVNLIFTFITTVTGLYIGIFASFLTGIMTIGIRSLATKVVSADDLGKAQSLFGICDAIGPALASPIYNKIIYQQTINSFIRAFWCVGVILDSVCIILIMWIYVAHKKRQKTCEKTEKQGKHTNGEQSETNKNNI